MNGKRLLHSIATMALVWTAVGCTASMTRSELTFGIRAARADLWDEAIFRWNRVVEKDPQSIAAHNNLAVAYEWKGLWEEARAQYDIALKIDPESRYVKSNYQKFKNRYESKKSDEEEDEEEKKSP